MITFSRVFAFKKNTGWLSVNIWWSDVLFDVAVVRADVGGTSSQVLTLSPHQQLQLQALQKQQLQLQQFPQQNAGLQRRRSTADNK